MRLALTRATIAVFWMASAFYALLAAIPFASKQFLEPRMVPAINAFADYHGWLAIPSLALAVAGLWPWIRSRDRRVLAWLAADAVATLAAVTTPGLGALQPSAAAIAVAAAALLPPAWLSLLDLSTGRANANANDGDRGTGLDFIACTGAAVVVAAVSLLATAFSGRSEPFDLIAIGRAGMLHLVVFSAGFAALSVIRGLGQFTPAPAAVEAWLSRIAVAGLLTFYFARVLLPALSYTGFSALAIAAAIGSALAIVIGPRGTAADGVAAALSGLFPDWAGRSAAATLAWVALAMGLLGAAAIQAQTSDWSFVVSKFIALTGWLVAMAAALRLVSRLPKSQARPRPMGTLLPFAASVAVLMLMQATGGAAAADAASAATRALDPSTRLIVDALARPAIADTGLFQYLQRHTNIPRSVDVDPVEVELASIAAPSPSRPHIFFFVVDSLRRDYLSPYNPAVSFTPAIDRFAKESTVFERAFTRYGATGLSVPAMWVGGLVLHKQYVTPFAPMNTLAKLLDREGYRQWLSADDIIDAIAPAPAVGQPLDVTVPVKDRRLCTTLNEVRGRLGQLTPTEPAFVYALPQDVHVSAINREGDKPIDGGSYPGFNAPYASRVKRLDACFGEFVDDLKARGLYDDSIIILTSDHGDSLGEGGRMGHAYTIYPEIIQVPLMVHLPAAMRKRFAADAKALAFTSDITSSLYALLGHQPAAPSPLFGQPLFGAGQPPAASRQAEEVVASSYGSVYGALINDARRLYIVDAVSLREYAYEMDGTAAGRAIAVQPADRLAGQRAIRQTVDEISRFYGFTPAE